jgi:membrane dipeptidase
MAEPHLIVDAHQDLAWNIQTFGRDYTRTVEDTRKHEQGTNAPMHNDDTLLGWDSYQRGRVAVVFSTLFAAPMRTNEASWDIICYRDEQEANSMYREQVNIYERLVGEHPDRFCMLRTRRELIAHIAGWESSNGEHPVGLILLMEGAEGILDISELEEWWQKGVRIIGPAWAGNRYCGGTNEPGPLTKEGYTLLEAMADIGFVLDLSHMDEPAALQALDHYSGPIIAGHANAAALLKGVDTNRHLSDRVIQGIIGRDGIIGVVPYNVFLLAGWKKGDARELVQIDRIISQIDYICQMAGDARHCGIGTDFDGGFGLQSVPEGIDSIADLQKFAAMLAQKGYSQEDTAAIFGRNWLRLLEDALPETE